MKEKDQTYPEWVAERLVEVKNTRGNIQFACGVFYGYAASRLIEENFLVILEILKQLSPGAFGNAMRQAEWFAILGVIAAMTPEENLAAVKALHQDLNDCEFNLKRSLESYGSN